jgi:hypothetical protein
MTLKSPNILIFTGFSGFTQRTHNVTKLIKKDFPGSSIDCLVFGKNNYDFLVNNNIYNNIYSVESILESTNSKANVTEDTNNSRVFEWEDKLKHSLTYLAYYERTFVQHTHSIKYLKKLSSNEIINHVVSVLDDLQAIVKGKDFVFVYTAASIISESLYHLSKFNNTSFACLNETRVGYSWNLINNTMDNHNNIDERYLEKNITNGGRNLLNSYKAALLANKKHSIESEYQASIVINKKINLMNISRFLINLIRHSSSDIHYLAPNRKQRFITNIKFKYRQALSQRYMFNNIPKEQYVYFPLSMIPEASTLIRATRYYDQLSSIKSLSLEIPLHWKLVVKEHPSMIGKNEIKFYKEISKIFNVVLLPPQISSSECIQNSEAVVTATGTTGIESLVLGKKTIVLGSSIYSNLNSVHSVENISEIGDILRTEWTNSDIKKQEEDMLIFASSILGAACFEDPDEILWTKKAFDDELNQVDLNIYQALRKSYLNAF